LGAGDHPDFDTVHIAGCRVEAIQGHSTRYTAVEGIVDLKDAIIANSSATNNIEYKRNQILVSTGAPSRPFYNLIMAVIDAGDEW